MALAFDGSAHGTQASSTTCSVTLSTSNSNDVIVVGVTCNQGPIVSVAAAGLTFSRIAQQENLNGAPAYTEYWRAIAASPLSSVSITVTQTSVGFIAVDAFGVSGADTATPGDPDASTPASTNGVTLPSIDTDAADTFIFGIIGISVLSNEAPVGWTEISSNDFLHTQYKIVSAAQSGLTIGPNNGTDNTQAVIADAIQMAAAGGGGGGFKSAWARNANTIIGGANR